MKAKFKFFLYGALVGIFTSGLIIVLIENASNRLPTKSETSTSELSIQYTSTSTTCQRSPSETVSSSLKMDINLASLEELKSLPGIGDVKAKSIIDFRKKYGNFTSVDELLYVPGIGDSLFK
jgi:competence protein ComEA